MDSSGLLIVDLEGLEIGGHGGRLFPIGAYHRATLDCGRRPLHEKSTML